MLIFIYSLSQKYQTNLGNNRKRKVYNYKKSFVCRIVGSSQRFFLLYPTFNMCCIFHETAEHHSTCFVKHCEAFLWVWIIVVIHHFICMRLVYLVLYTLSSTHTQKRGQEQWRKWIKLTNWCDLLFHSKNAAIFFLIIVSLSSYNKFECHCFEKYRLKAAPVIRRRKIFRTERNYLQWWLSHQSQRSEAHDEPPEHINLFRSYNPATILFFHGHFLIPKFARHVCSTFYSRDRCNQQEN